MTLKRDILQILFGSILTALFIQVGVLSPANDFWTNVVSALVVYIVTRFLGFVFGGGRR